jgi:23S rRNA (cytidine2498-2'-O)-methyltransferase
MAGSGPKVESAGATGYLAADGFVAELRHELGEPSAAFERLLLRPGAEVRAAWAQNVWHDPVWIRFSSIAEAARALRALGRSWALYSHTLHRRAALIEAELPRVACRPLAFPASPPATPLGSWSLVDAHTLLAAASCSSPFRHGEIELVEDHQAPPSRAYLKLWEAFVRLGHHPGRSDRCLDLGASPGGWTWAVQQLGAEVLAVDKAPLDARVAQLPRVRFLQGSAFGLEPRTLGAFDWLLCDVVCYPEALYRLVLRWLDAGSCRNFVCTLKFQGETDHAVAERFAAIPGSTLMHLHHNRHELTWARLAE